MAKPPPPPRSFLLVVKAASITIAASVAFLYVIGSMGGKKPPAGAVDEGVGPAGEAQQSAAAPAEGDAACAASAKIAANVKDLAKGEVAAMTIATKPEPMPDYAFDGPDGAPVSLGSFKGKTALFNIWATWCVPCRAEMPALDRLQEAFAGQNFQVVAVNVDTTRLERAKAFLAETGVKSLTYYGDPKANLFYELKQSGKALGLPTTLLIGPDGCQIGLMNGPAAWDSADAKALISRALETPPN
ncbi:TlpA family protein disulfide reductase [Methylocystis sp. H4A]|uniref:thiol:disulfide interchange protein TlpA n=1 Tax=Methylocystis sp. H4A TaxID=2785788 RepID=UPI0018C26FD8|nr:TlpA disulfide reductase family protein [Methylocystis sp. H4A]MBG0801576.1 TlpA family protein disulfide reductase [Methylocystis sp. H4A]MBG0801926.1 TlpA family protein disulfide reductase [Methylocystis sp. H4A]